MKSTIRRAIPLLVLSLAALAPAVAGERLHGFEIRRAFNGITLDGIYRGGAFFSETYNDDGTIRYHDADGADSGRWSVSGDTFCTFYDRQPGACFYVLSHGDNCFTFHQSTEDETGRQGPSQDWASEGWNRGRPATCEKRPEAEI
jgi:hypothetical protein